MRVLINADKINKHKNFNYIMVPDGIINSLKNVFVVAKWEFYRPTKSKFSFVSLVVLIAFHRLMSMMFHPDGIGNLFKEVVALAVKHLPSSVQKSQITVYGLK